MKPVTRMRWWEYLLAAIIAALVLVLAWWIMGRPVELLRRHVPDNPVPGAEVRCDRNQTIGG